MFSLPICDKQSPIFCYRFTARASSARLGPSSSRLLSSRFRLRSSSALSAACTERTSACTRSLLPFCDASARFSSGRRASTSSPQRASASCNAVASLHHLELASLRSAPNTPDSPFFGHRNSSSSEELITSFFYRAACLSFFGLVSGEEPHILLKHAIFGGLYLLGKWLNRGAVCSVQPNHILYALLDEHARVE